ncbi:hypothetical protein PFICI_11240 [Pestalotiopsis fici W106-1]|uniref:Uncharacterized protein n=1 Tax=Pestalotiopsis fici (strain W106-1 / CGMCC3.15140) TaxID=1229662 RepID=W3WWW9_PESFW|nr:uncharacterized protein PFICI_11240 [Pestalotiopsis fici W106-1]ETS77366.1 hypothetical protein PFICI_11240 [Pestalotiopsis fici W106-1]
MRTVGPSFHHQVRRSFNKSFDERLQSGGGTDEQTPLIGNGHSNGVVESTWHEILSDITRTPATDSPDLFIRWIAHAWHVVKVTLISGKVYASWACVTEDCHC